MSTLLGENGDKQNKKVKNYSFNRFKLLQIPPSVLHPTKPQV